MNVTVTRRLVEHVSWLRLASRLIVTRRFLSRLVAIILTLATTLLVSISRLARRTLETRLIFDIIRLLASYTTVTTSIESIPVGIIFKVKIINRLFPRTRLLR